MKCIMRSFPAVHCSADCNFAKHAAHQMHEGKQGNMGYLQVNMHKQVAAAIS